MNTHALGALWGAAVGDALGTTLEFSRPQAAVELKFPDQLTGPHTDVTGQGPFRLEAGQVTDDTQMAAALYKSLLQFGEFNGDDVAQAYANWARDAFDIGGQTSGSLRQVATCATGAKFTAGHRYWSQGRNGAGNGSLMRTSPIGVFFAEDYTEVVQVSVLDSVITHADPRCALACAAYNAAIALAVVSEGEAPVYQYFAAAEEALYDAVDFINEHPVMKYWYTQKELGDALQALTEDLALAEKPDPQLTSLIHGSAGFVRTAFRYAFWCLRHATDYRSAMIGVVNMGGDADTNGAIVGGLLGAYFGLDGIPETWVNRCRNALKPTGTTPSRWWSICHPRIFDVEDIEDLAASDAALKAAHQVWAPSTTALPDEDAKVS